jgi:hypothetical protein
VEEDGEVVVGDRKHHSGTPSVDSTWPEHIRPREQTSAAASRWPCGACKFPCKWRVPSEAIHSFPRR